jgi:hypothetical protein
MFTYSPPYYEFYARSVIKVVKNFSYNERWYKWMQAGYACRSTQELIFNIRRDRLTKVMKEIKRLQNARLVLAMAQHPRLGAGSPLKYPSADVLAKIAYFVW